jgi:hypothetical protein
MLYLHAIVTVHQAMQQVPRQEILLPAAPPVAIPADHQVGHPVDLPGRQVAHQAVLPVDRQAVPPVVIHQVVPVGIELEI